MSRLESQHAPQVIFRLLSTSKLFAGMPQDARDELSSYFSATTFRQGDVILGAGSPRRCLGVILEGQAAVQARTGDETFRVATLEAGSFFGEMSFFDPNSPRTADIVANTDGVCAVMQAEDYEYLRAQGSPHVELLERNVLDSLATRIRTTNETLATLLTETDKGILAALARFFFGS